MAFRHSIDVRYGECDQQGVVFNANYLAYIDDALDHWLRSLDRSEWPGSWDAMLKVAKVVWHGPLRWPERLDLDLGVCRRGRTSFDVAYVLTVEGRAVADAVVTYVTVATGAVEPIEMPDVAVSALGELVDVPPSHLPR